MRMGLYNPDKYQQVGLLLLRIGLGIMFLCYGVPKLMSGVEGWTKLGTVMKLLGINFAPAIWGLMSATIESLGGILLLLGLFTRSACFFLSMNLLVAIIMHVSTGSGFAVASHAIDLEIVFVSLVFIGPGKYSLDEILWKINW